MPRPSLVLLVILLVPLPSACDGGTTATTIPPGNTLFVGRVFDGTASFDGSVQVDARGVIVDVRREPQPAVDGAIEIGEGTLLPGLIDLHTHITATGGTVRTVPVADHEPNLKALLRNGVTSFLHLGGMARVGFEIRRRERDGELLSPRVFAVGPFLDPPGSSHCASGVQQLDHCIALPTPEAATNAVEALERVYGPDVIKITHDSGFAERPSNPFDDASLRAIVAAAGDTPVVAHVRNVSDIDSAVAAGVGTITHLPFFERFTAEQAAPWVAAATRFIPTLGIHRREHALATGDFDLDDPTLAQDAPAAVLAELRAFEADDAATARIAEVRENVLANFRALIAAGAVVLPGSDAGVFGSIHGRSLVDELEEMSREGLTNEEALASATSNAADFLGRADLGRVAVGATADLVIVEGDPSRDIAALRRVRRVFLGGEEIVREALEVDRHLPLERDPARVVAGDATCLRTSECAADETCTRLYRCAERCDTSSECPAATFCGPDIDDARGCYPDLGCDLIAQNCGNATACVPMANGATWCASAGTAAIGAPCDGTSIETLCGRGGRCTAGICEQLCDLSAGGCPAGQACTSLEPETGVVIGACR